MHLGLGETYLSQARSALQKDFNGKAVDCVIEAITVLARCESFVYTITRQVLFTITSLYDASGWCQPPTHTFLGRRHTFLSPIVG